MRSWFVVLIALIVTSVAEIAAGQVIEVPSFEVVRPTIEKYVGALEVAVAPMERCCSSTASMGRAVRRRRRR